MFLKNYIYIILLFYREPYQKYKILTKPPLQYIKITSIFSRSLGKAYIQKNIFIDIYTHRDPVHNSYTEETTPEDPTQVGSRSDPKPSFSSNNVTNNKIHNKKSHETVQQIERPARSSNLKQRDRPGSRRGTLYTTRTLSCVQTPR